MATPAHAPHPSRAAHKCSDCTHCTASVSLLDRLACNHPTAPVRLTDGAPTLLCAAAREDSSFCGDAALLFKPQPCCGCGGSGKQRRAYGRDLGACPDCTKRPISNANATTSAPECPLGSKA